MTTENNLSEFTRPLYAHSLAGRPVADWHPLDRHLLSVAKLSAACGSRFLSADWAWNAGILHDLGKATADFQAYLRRANQLDDEEYDRTYLGRVKHSAVGATVACDLFNRGRMRFGRILAYLIAGHHAGLPDFDGGGRGALPERLKEGQEALDGIRNETSAVCAKLRPITALPKRVTQENIHFWIRMLFSCLVDADFLNTECVINSARTAQRDSDYDLIRLKRALDRHMSELTAGCQRTPLNSARRETLDLCRQAALGVPGLYSLTVPTGGGKTLAAMTFALDHAIRHRKRRVIYVIPYTSIIEQTAAILASILGPENVVEHHSNLDPDLATPRAMLATENWDAPIIITTNVQFFESLYAARPGRCRKLHNIVDSVVVLDEAQLIPPRWLTPCVAAINDLCRTYGVTVLMSTATQPALPGLDTPVEIVPNTRKLYDDLKRTEIRFPLDLNLPTSWDSLAEELSGHERVLCIVNTRADCYELYRRMPNGTVYLSALMCGQHRSEVIKSIKDRLKNGDSVRVISTQLVEAGVDIDFPVVYRALTGLDSVVQAAGRCNREGTITEGHGTVVVFVPPQPSPPGLLRKGEDKTRELHSLPEFDPDDPAWFRKYFELFYESVNDTGKEFMKLLVSSNTLDLKFAFRTAADSFQLIDGRDQVAVLVQYGQGKKLIQQLRDEGPSRRLLRKLQRYIVNVHRNKANELKDRGLLEELPFGFVTHGLPGTYSEKIGLDVWGDSRSYDELIGV